MRELKSGDRCEHISRIGSVHTGYRDEQCSVRHQQRIDGKPQQLVLIKDGRKSRFVCTKHAPEASITRTRARQKPKKDYQAEQLDLL